MQYANGRTAKVGDRIILMENWKEPTIAEVNEIVYANPPIIIVTPVHAYGRNQNHLTLSSFEQCLHIDDFNTLFTIDDFNSAIDTSI